MKHCEAVTPLSQGPAEMTDEAKEQLARQLYQKYRGRLIRLPILGWYFGEGDMTETEDPTPVLARVSETDEDDVTRWISGYLDAIWELEVLEGPGAGHNGWAYSLTIEPDDTLIKLWTDVPEPLFARIRRTVCAFLRNRRRSCLKS